MEGLMFLVACVAIGLVALWVMRNDKAKPGDPTAGLFAMSSGPPDDSRTEDRPGSPRRGKPVSRGQKSLPRRSPR